jgi:branched-subunit amino acid transport protein
VSEVWLAIIVVGGATVMLKATGPVLLGGRELPPRLNALVGLLAPAVLAALVLTQVVGGHRELVFDARLVGLVAAGVAIALRAPLVLVVVIAAAATAAARALTG